MEEQIDIYLKYIGKVDPQKHELTPEKFAEKERKRRKRVFNRAYMRSRQNRCGTGINEVCPRNTI